MFIELYIPKWLSLVQRQRLNGQISTIIIVAFGLRSHLFSASFHKCSRIIVCSNSNAAMGRVFNFLAEEKWKTNPAKARQLSDMKVKNDLWSSPLVTRRIHDFSATAHGSKVAVSDRLGLKQLTVSITVWSSGLSGSIRIDGVDTKDMEAFEYDAFSMVLQDGSLDHSWQSS